MLRHSVLFRSKLETYLKQALILTGSQDVFLDE